MSDNHLPQWTARLDVARPAGEHGFSDLLPLVTHHYRLHSQAVDFLGPYNARQRSSAVGYIAPTKEQLRQVIRRGPVNDFTYEAFLSALVRFCERHQGRRALPTPHPSVIHSIQLPLPAFEVQAGPPGVTMVKVIGVDVGVVVKGLRYPETMRLLILRPKLSRLGTASATNWEALFFKDAHGYIPDWTDSEINPKYSGVIQ